MNNDRPLFDKLGTLGKISIIAAGLLLFPFLFVWYVLDTFYTATFKN